MLLHKSAQNTPLSSLSPLNSEGRNAGTLKLGVENAWTRDDTFVTGVELSDSQRAEPPTDDQLSVIIAEGTPGVPEESSIPLISIAGKDLEKNLLLSEDSLGSVPMSMSSLLGSVVGLHPWNLFSPVTRQFELWKYLMSIQCCQLGWHRWRNWKVYTHERIELKSWRC